MYILKNIEVSTSDFWYDLKEGYLNPYGICGSDDDIAKVVNAIEVLKDFEKSCEEQIEDFIQ